jgi:hypothetical protein
VSVLDLDDALMANAAIDIDHDHPEFGHLFITDELDRRNIRTVCDPDCLAGGSAAPHALTYHARPAVPIRAHSRDARS